MKQTKCLLNLSVVNVTAARHTNILRQNAHTQQMQRVSGWMMIKTNTRARERAERESEICEYVYTLSKDTLHWLTSDSTVLVNNLWHLVKYYYFFSSPRLCLCISFSHLSQQIQLVSLYTTMSWFIFVSFFSCFFQIASLFFAWFSTSTHTVNA